MYIYLMCFNVLIFFSNIYIWNFILYKINIKKTKKKTKMKLKIECNILMMKCMIIGEIIII